MSRRTRTTISIVLIGISILAWVLLLANPGHIITVQHCHISSSGLSPESLQMLLIMNPISNLLIGWGLMVVAMMLPKLIIPIRFIYIHSFIHRRFLTALIFVFAYTAVWMSVGLLMIFIILGLNLFFSETMYYPAIVVGLIALIWQFSPIKQQFLNLGHDHWILSAFGWAANRDAFLFGIMHGCWCVGSGWALMLFPMLLSNGHNLAMILVTFIMISEHLEHPQVPKWKLNLPTRLIQIILVQIQIKLHIGKFEAS